MVLFSSRHCSPSKTSMKYLAPAHRSKTQWRRSFNVVPNQGGLQYITDSGLMRALPQVQMVRHNLYHTFDEITFFLGELCDFSVTFQKASALSSSMNTHYLVKKFICWNRWTTFHVPFSSCAPCSDLIPAIQKFRWGPPRHPLPMTGLPILSRLSRRG